MSTPKVLLALVLGSACALTPIDDEHAGHGGKTDDPSQFNVTWDATIPHIVPERVHNYLETYDFGDYHLAFHMTRRWFVMSPKGRDWLKSLGERDADLQEGEETSGVEFLTMHAAMIEHLREKLGDTPVDGDPEYATFADVLDGWETDEQVLAHLRAIGGDTETFQAALTRVNDFASFPREDDFGLFLQTTLRLAPWRNTQDYVQRVYTQAGESAGIHNWLHGAFSEPDSPIDVGNPQTNLSNVLFWGIHGWIERKWEDFQRVHQRTLSEQELYDDELARFRTHMTVHGEHPTPKAPVQLAREIAPTLMGNTINCGDLAEDTVMQGCEASW